MRALRVALALAFVPAVAASQTYVTPSNLAAQVAPLIPKASPTTSGTVLSTQLPGQYWYGQIGTRTFVPQLQYTTQYGLHTAETSLSYLYIRAASPCAAFAVPNFFGMAETSAGTTTYQVSIEAPAGTTPINATFGGARSGVITAPIGLTDPVCPAGGFLRGEKVGYRTYSTNPAGVLIDTGSGYAQLAGEGEVLGSAGSLTSITGGGPVPSAGIGNLFAPIAVLGWHTGPSICIEGDSRSFGQAPASMGYGDAGEDAPTVGAAMPYLNLGTPGEPASNAEFHYADRAGLLPFCSANLVEYGVNDFVVANETWQQAYSSLQGLISAWLVPTGKPIFETTVPTYTTWTIPTPTTAPTACGSQPAQTPSAHAVDIATLNAVLMQAPIAGVDAVFDVASVTNDPATSGTTLVANMFRAEGATATGPNTTYTCLHETVAGVSRILSSGAINTNMLSATAP